MAGKPKKTNAWRIIQDGQVIAQRADAKETRQLILDGKMRSNAKVVLLEIESNYGDETERDLSEEIDFMKSTLSQADAVARLINPTGYYRQLGMILSAVLLAAIPTIMSLEALKQGAFGIKDWIVELMYGADARAYQYEWIMGPLPFWILYFIWFVIMLAPGFIIGLLLSRVMTRKAVPLPPGFRVTPLE